MKKSLLVICISVFSVFLFSCGGGNIEPASGYIPSGAEMKVSFSKDELHIPTCEIPVVVGSDTVNAHVRIMSGFPGRFLVIFHYKHPLANTDSIIVLMDKDKELGTYQISQAMIKDN